MVVLVLLVLLLLLLLSPLLSPLRAGLVSSCCVYRRSRAMRDTMGPWSATEGGRHSVATLRKAREERGALEVLRVVM